MNSEEQNAISAYKIAVAKLFSAARSLSTATETLGAVGLINAQGVVQKTTEQLQVSDGGVPIFAGLTAESLQAFLVIGSTNLASLWTPTNRALMTKIAGSAEVNRE